VRNCATKVMPAENSRDCAKAFTGFLASARVPKPGSRLRSGRHDRCKRARPLHPLAAQARTRTRT
jgi:hypothetical protein